MTSGAKWVFSAIVLGLGWLMFKAWTAPEFGDRIALGVLAGTLVIEFLLIGVACLKNYELPTHAANLASVRAQSSARWGRSQRQVETPAGHVPRPFRASQT